MPLDQETILALLAKERTGGSRTVTVASPNIPGRDNPVIHKGPLRWCDFTMKCANKGCGAPTVLKLEGIPRCAVHALRKMNDRLADVAV